MPRPDPIPFAPAHRPIWRRWRRRCSCGLPWPCIDRAATRYATGALTPDRDTGGSR